MALIDFSLSNARRFFSSMGSSVILYIYFNGASTSPFAACSVNNKGCEEEAIITTQHQFPNVYFQVTFSFPFSSWLLKLPNVIEDLEIFLVPSCVSSFAYFSKAECTILPLTID